MRLNCTELHNVCCLQKLHRIQRKLVALCQYRFFIYDNVTDGGFLKFLKLPTVTNRRHYLMHRFFFLFLLIRVEPAARLFCAVLLFEFFRVILETPPRLPLLPKSLRLLDVSAANHLCNSSISLGNPFTSWKQILRQSVPFFISNYLFFRA